MVAILGAIACNGAIIPVSSINGNYKCMGNRGKIRLQKLLRTNRENRFEEMWNASGGDYSRVREIAEFILGYGAQHKTLLPLPSAELADLIKSLSKEFYLGVESQRLGYGKSFLEKYLDCRGHDLVSFYDWCKESGIKSDGEFLGILLDVFGVLKDRHCITK